MFKRFDSYDAKIRKLPQKGFTKKRIIAELHDFAT
jgi:hypothetical protein